MGTGTRWCTSSFYLPKPQRQRGSTVALCSASPLCLSLSPKVPRSTMFRACAGDPGKGVTPAPCPAAGCHHGLRVISGFWSGCVSSTRCPRCRPCRDDSVHPAGTQHHPTPLCTHPMSPARAAGAGRAARLPWGRWLPPPPPPPQRWRLSTGHQRLCTQAGEGRRGGDGEEQAVFPPSVVFCVTSRSFEVTTCHLPRRVLQNQRETERLNFICIPTPSPPVSLSPSHPIPILVPSQSPSYSHPIPTPSPSMSPSSLPIPYSSQPILSHPSHVPILFPSHPIGSPSPSQEGSPRQPPISSVG